ncbi:MAG: hypothetical protein ACFB2W_26570 [Leptolyngbyaceae cyanobacterium]
MPIVLYGTTMNNPVDSNQSPKGARMWLCAAVMAIALFILLANMLTFVVFSFNVSLGAGLRSLAAAVLPFTVVIYMRLFTRLLRVRRRIPSFNLYFLFTVWTIFLFGFTRSLYGFAFPLAELMFSITLAATTLRYSSQSVSAFLSCCYGVITGFLIYVVFAGLPFSFQ